MLSVIPGCKYALYIHGLATDTPRGCDELQRAEVNGADQSEREKGKVVGTKRGYITLLAHSRPHPVTLLSDGQVG
jgi:hypothetical protein